MYTGRTPRVQTVVSAHFLALGLALGLSACATPEAEDVEIGFRNPTAILAGTTRFEPTRFAGTWQTVACLGVCDGSVRYLQATDGVYVRQVGAAQTAFLIPAPGILRENGGGQTLVVMWVDEGFRTAAIGDADGRWAAILSRTGKPVADHLSAATEILDFNGWRVSQLRKSDG